MQILRRLTELLFLFIFLTHCTYAQKTIPLENGAMPGWVNNPQSFYPEQQYIVGVGSGDTRKAAEYDAAASIARVFKSKIKVDQTLVENYLESQNKLTASSQMLKKTSVNSEQDLKNIKIAKAYFSSQQGVYYVLAYLDRAETAGMYSQDIQQNNEKISQYFADYQNEKNKLHQFAFLKKALMLNQINELLNQQYQILTFGKQIPATISRNKLEKNLMQLKDKITVELIADAGTPPEVRDYLKEMIGQLGFKMVSGPADFTFQYSLDVRTTNIRRANIKALSWKLTLRVKDNVNQSTLKAFNVKKRTVAISAEEARSRMLLKVQDALMKKFYKQFNQYVMSL